jgi:hypothetical protein
MSEDNDTKVEQGVSSSCSIAPSHGHEKVKDTWFWIRDSTGHGSVTVTFVTVAFWVTTLAYILSMVESIGPVPIRPFDVAACSTYFIPILTLYFGRKFTEAKFPHSHR